MSLRLLHEFFEGLPAAKIGTAISLEWIERSSRLVLQRMAGGANGVTSASMTTSCP